MYVNVVYIKVVTSLATTLLEQRPTGFIHSTSISLTRKSLKSSLLPSTSTTVEQQRFRREYFFSQAFYSISHLVKRASAHFHLFA